MEPFDIHVPVPAMGATVHEMTVVAVMVAVGQVVERGGKLAEMESDKSAFDFEAPATGEVLAVLARAGDVVPVGEPLFRMRTGDASVAHLRVAAAVAPGGVAVRPVEPVRAAAAPVVVPERVEVVKPRVAVAAPAVTAVARGVPGGAGGAGRWTPRAVKVAEEHGLTPADLPDLQGTGPGGRISGDDVQAWVKAHRGGNGAAPAVAVVPAHGPSVLAAEAVQLAGLGFAVPRQVRSTAELLPRFPGKTEPEILRLTGIRERHVAGDDETATGLAAAAARAALAESRIEPSALDGVIMATILPDQPVPAMASALARELGAPGALAFDLNAACSGWLYALEVGRALIRVGTARTVLVATAELLSRITNPDDLGTAFLFGDGAGAAVLTAGEGGHRLGRMKLSGDAGFYAAIQRTSGGARHPATNPEKDGAAFYLQMDGAAVFKQAVIGFSRILEEQMARHGIAPAEVAWVVPHQANERILRAVSQRVGIPFERFVVTIGRYGNTSAASVSMALGWADQEGLLKAGDKILFCSVGAGLTFAGGLLEW